MRPDFIPNVTSTTGSDPSFLISDMTWHLVLLSFRFLDVTRLRNSLWYKKSWVTELVYMESHCWTVVLCSSLFERFWDCYKLPGVLLWGGVCGGVISRQMHHIPSHQTHYAPINVKPEGVGAGQMWGIWLFLWSPHSGISLCPRWSINT